VKGNRLKVKIANSKNENANRRNNGIGIANVRKRLAFIYPGNHELKLSDEGHFFIVSLMIQLNGEVVPRTQLSKVISQSIEHETTMPAYR
jgi:LytS/YehU family sensor histidine kinase